MSKKQGRNLLRRRHEWPPDRASSDMRATLWLPLLDTEVLSLDIRRSWRYLYPDADRD